MRMISKLVKLALPVSIAMGLMAIALPASATTFPTCRNAGNLGATCIWVDIQSINNGGEQADFFGSNADFTTINRANPFLDWNDVASSAFNNGGGSYNAALFVNSNWTGWRECLLVRYGNADFTKINFNDQESSNDWYGVGTTYSCNHTN